MVNVSYGGHFCDSGPKITKNSVYSCFLAKNHLFGPKYCLNCENCNHKEDLPLDASCFDSSHRDLRGSPQYLSTGLRNVSKGIVHKLTICNGKLVLLSLLDHPLNGTGFRHYNAWVLYIPIISMHFKTPPKN